MKKYLILSLCLLFSSAAFAQSIKYQGEVQAGYAFGIGDNPADRLSIHMINGVRINPYFSAGIGVGLDYYDVEGTSFLSMPLFLNLKGYLPVSQKVSLFASFDLGYSVALKSEEGDLSGYDAKLGMKGLMVTPALGVSFKVAETKAVNLSLGYDVKTATLDVSGASATTKCNAIGLKLGYAF